MNTTTSKESELSTNLMRAEARLGIIARMAQLNMQETLNEDEFAKLLQTILAASGHDVDS